MFQNCPKLSGEYYKRKNLVSTYNNGEKTMRNSAQDLNDCKNEQTRFDKLKHKHE